VFDCAFALAPILCNNPLLFAMQSHLPHSLQRSFTFWPHVCACLYRCNDPSLFGQAFAFAFAFAFITVATCCCLAARLRCHHSVTMCTATILCNNPPLPVMIHHFSDMRLCLPLQRSISILQSSVTIPPCVYAVTILCNYPLLFCDVLLLFGHSFLLPLFSATICHYSVMIRQFSAMR